MYHSFKILKYTFIIIVKDRYRLVVTQLKSVGNFSAPICGVNFQVAGLNFFPDKKLPQHPFQLSSVSSLIYSNSLITQSENNEGTFQEQN